MIMNRGCSIRTEKPQLANMATDGAKPFWGSNLPVRRTRHRVLRHCSYPELLRSVSGAAPCAEKRG
jgi:hypothetical protein